MYFSFSFDILFLPEASFIMSFFIFLQVLRDWQTSGFYLSYHVFCSLSRVFSNILIWKTDQNKSNRAVRKKK